MVSSMRSRRSFVSRRIAAGAAACSAIGLAVAGSVAAQEQLGERSSQAVVIEPVEKLRFSGSGDLSDSVQGIEIGVERRNLFDTPFFVSAKGRLAREQFLPYDLLQEGLEAGVGWELDPHTDLLATFRNDDYRTFNVSATADPTFQNVMGRSNVTALGLSLRRDTRDDPYYPTAGCTASVGGELALEELGGDHEFSRLELEGSGYVTPFHRPEGNWLGDITLAGHLEAGWVEDL